MKLVRIAAAIVLAFLGLAAAPSARAQSLKTQVVGTWTLNSGLEKTADGKTASPWAAGRLMFDASGHVAFFLVGKDRGKADPNPRLPLGPFVAYYGTYSVDEAKKTLTYTIEFGASPAFDKTVRVTTVALSGDTMTTTGMPVKTPQGDIIPVNEWRRAK